MTNRRRKQHSTAKPCPETNRCVLLALFAALSAGQVLHLFLVDLDLPGLLHLITQVGDKQAEKLLLLVLQKRIADLVFLGGKVLRSRFLLLQERQDGARAAV